MKRIEKLNVVHSEVKKDYKPKMVKGRTGWLVKGFVLATLIGAGTLATASTTEAASWTPNTAESIRAKIKDGDTSYTFAEGDTFYEIGRAINVKYTVLMELNGFEEGSQYTVPVGTTITFDGRKVTLTDKEGNVVNEKILSDDAKVDQSKPFMNQESDEIKSNSSNQAQGTSNNGINNTNNNGQTKPNPTKPVDPTNPVKPVDPVKPIDPTDPVNPVDPTDPEQSELEKLKAYLTELENQLEIAKAELSEAEQNLLNAQNAETIDFDSEIAALEAVIEAKVSQQETISNEIILLENNQVEAQQEVIEAQNKLAEDFANQKAAQEAVSAAQAALDEIKETGNEEQIINAEAALEAAKLALDNTTSQVAQQEAIVNQAEANLSSIEAEINNKNEALAQADTIADRAKLAELKAQKEQQENNKQNIEELEKIVEEKRQAVEELEAKIAETKQKIAAIELKLERSEAIKTINNLSYLSADRKTVYANQVNSALTSGEINAIVEAAINENEIEKVEHEATEAMKKAKAEAIKTVNALEYLDDEGKSDYITIIEAAENIETISVAVNNAKAEDAKLKAEYEANKELAEAKAAAKAEINGLEYLSEESKTEYNKQVSDAKTVEAITPILEAAKQENAELKAEHEANEKLKAAKAAAKAEINGLEYLSEESKTEYNKQVSDAKTVEVITPILEAAQQENAELKVEHEANEKLKAAKVEAINKLEELNLTEVEKVDFTNKINEVESVEAIAPIVEAAKQQSDINDATASEKELAEAKEVAKSEIKKLNLTTNEKADFEKAIDEATTISEINSQLAKAQAQSDKNDEAEKLAKAKEQATEEIEKLEYLPESNKESFISSLEGANTVAEVNSIVKNAKELDEQFKNDAEAAEKLEEARKAALIELESLNLKGNTTFEERIKVASTEAEINSILAEAKAESAKNDQEEEAAKKLEAARQEALEELETLNLGSTKNYYIRLINDASSIEEINSIMSEAREVSDENNGGNSGENPIIDSIPKKDDEKVNNAKNDIQNDIAISNEAAQDLTNAELSGAVGDAFLDKLNQERREQGRGDLAMTEDEHGVEFGHIRAVTVMYNGVEHDAPGGLPSDGKPGAPSYNDGDTQFVGYENISQSYIPKSQINSDEDLANAIADAMFQQYIEEERNAALGNPLQPGDSQNPGHYNNLVMGDTDETLNIGVYVVDMGDYYVVTTYVSAGTDGEYIEW